MATSSDSHMLTCAICFENKINKNPRGLPCQHSFCLSCLQQWHATRVGQEKQSPTSVECPVCRQTAKLPGGGIVGLPVDFKVSEVSDIMASLSTDFLCQKCSQDGLSKPMKAMCKNCNRRLCEDCVGRHKRVKHFASHLIVEDLCSNHLAEVEYFCLTCMTRLCTDCVISDEHQDHEISDIAQADQEVEAHFCKQQKRLDEQLDILDSKISGEISTGASCEQFIAETVRRCKDDIKAELDSHFESLIEQHARDHRTGVKGCYQEYTKMCSDGRSVSRDCTSFRNNEKPTEHRDVRKLNKKLRHTIESIESRQNLPRTRLLSAANCQVAGLEVVNDMIRKCTLSCKVNEIMADINHFSKPQWVFQIKCGPYSTIKIARQIRILPDGSVVVLDNEGPPRKVSTTGEYVTAYDMPAAGAVCVYQGDVFFSEQNPSYVRKFASDGSRHDFKIHPPLQRVHQINVHEENIYFLFVWSGIIEQRSLKDVGTRKNFINHDGILCSFVIVPNGKSQHFYCTNEEGQKVEVFDEHGTFLRSIGNSGASKLIRPVDIKLLANGNLIVADHDSHRVVEYQTDGTYVRDLLTKSDGLIEPDDMDYMHPFLWIKQGIRGFSLNLLRLV